MQTSGQVGPKLRSDVCDDEAQSWREGKVMDNRELTRHERAAIRKLITGMCANYDSEYGCLPLDYGSCYMLDKRWTGAYCKYFQNAVLPLDPKLEATLLGRAAPEIDTCAICGKPFVADETRAYCSPDCQAEGNRRRSRERMRKKRRSDKA